MIKYIKLMLLLSFVCGQNFPDSFIMNRNIRTLYITDIKNDVNIKSKNLSDLFYLNNQLNDHIKKHKENINTISINSCNSNYINHDIERFNKMMVYPIKNTPECIFSFYSSLEYER
jgi:hypothetical protein